MKNIKCGKDDRMIVPFCEHLEKQQADQAAGEEASGPLLTWFNKCFLKVVRQGSQFPWCTYGPLYPLIAGSGSSKSDKNSSMY